MAPQTIWYGAACCNNLGTSTRIVANSAASESAVVDNLDSQCAGTITEQQIVSVV